MKIFFVLLFSFFSIQNISACHEKTPEKIYIISLDRTPHRLKFVKNQLDKFGFQCTHFHAVDGKLCKVTDLATGKTISNKEKGHSYIIADPSEKYKNAEFVYSYKEQDLTPGECGCFLSHRAVWQDIVKHGYKNAIIFEDDVEFFHNFKENLLEVMKNIPDDFDIFFLDIGMCKPYAEKTYFVSAGFWLSNFSNTSSPYYASLKSTRRIWGLHAYCVNSKSAEKLLKLTEIAYVPVDAAIIDHAENLNLYVSKIKLVSGNHFYSEITKLGR
ncbi:MAG: glycosyltransferase family 25 protein [Alphaproteobacteria bacterium]|nr:glycosyltransferase family 25 protein [Alphaproteobacteria bacterium]